jgi:integrase
MSAKGHKSTFGGPPVGCTSALAGPAAQAFICLVLQGPSSRLRSDFGTPEFAAEYQSAVSGTPVVAKRGVVRAGSLAWLIEQYRESTAWTKYSLATRRQRENIFKQVLATAGDTPATQITKGVIVAGRDRRRGTPYQARHFLDAMRGLFGWAVDAQHCKTDPTFGVDNPARAKGGGFRVWTEDEVAAYERKWPVGTRQRVWLDVLLYSGLRRGDAVRYGRQHVNNNVGTIKVQKSGYTIEVTLPILPALATTLAAGPCGDLTFIAGARGRPLSAPKNRSAMNSGTLAVRLRCRDRRTASESLARHAQPTLARLRPN